VVWLSKLEKSVRGGSWLEVVRLADLKSLIKERGREPLRLLQGLGMISRKETQLDDAYKAVVFDVKREWLCRPGDLLTEGGDQSGVKVCEGRQRRPIRHHRKGYTGCGYAMDTAASVRGPDVFRIQWQSASAWGFCTMPLDRFLSGA
jgi:hypothetical protein